MNNSTMDAKTTSIIAYLSFIGLIIALTAGDKEGAKFHLNQALVINVLTLISLVPIVGFFWGIFMAIMWIMGLISAINEEEKELPLIGKIHLLK